MTKNITLDEAHKEIQRLQLENQLLHDELQDLEQANADQEQRIEELEYDIECYKEHGKPSPIGYDLSDYAQL